jgi:hypothetical protein
VGGIIPPVTDPTPDYTDYDTRLGGYAIVVELGSLERVGLVDAALRLGRAQA